MNVRQILDDLRDDPLMADLSLERGVSYAVEFINLIGLRKSLERKNAIIEIKDNRGRLPCDFVKILGVRDMCSKIGYLASTSLYDDKPNKFAYRISGKVIYTTINRDIEISYLSIPTDCDGFPEIPDYESLKVALELYIQKKHFSKLFNRGAISQNVLQHTLNEYNVAALQARTDLMTPSLDEMEGIKNLMNSSLMKSHEHIDGFDDINMERTRRRVR